MSYEYLATPFSSRNADIERERHDGALLIATKLWRDGRAVFSPIVHNYRIAQLGGLEGGFERYREFDKAMIAGSNGVIVAMMKGWRASVGVNAEMLLARSIDKPIVMLDPVRWQFENYVALFAEQQGLI